MNKILSMATIVALVTTFSFAQEGGLKFGIRAGFNLVDFSSGIKEMDEEINMGMGFGGGVVASIPITSSLSFNPELNFFYRKLLSIDMDVGSGIKMEAYENEFALSIPAMLQFTPIEAVPFYLAAGVQLDVPFSPEMTAKITAPAQYCGTYIECGEETEKIDEDRSKIDFGIALGLGYNITPNFGIDLRCFIGLTKTGFDDEDEDGNETKDKSSFNQYGIGVTYFF